MLFISLLVFDKSYFSFRLLKVKIWLKKHYNVVIIRRGISTNI